MFIYVFRNDQYLGEYRKIVLNFSIPDSWIMELRAEGWYLSNQ